MKGKRQKKVKKNLKFYQQFFGFEPPYTVLVDAQFCESALQAKVNILEQLPKYLDAPVRVVTTKCVIAECEKRRSKMYGPLKVLEQFEVVPCKHKNSKIVIPTVCVKNLAKRQERMKCIIGAQDESLNAKIRDLPGVPFLLFVHGAMTLQAPSTASYHASKDILAKSLAPSDYELSVIRELKKEMFGEPEPVTEKKRKRKGPKQPNPLSCLKKKKKKAQNNQSDNTANTTEDGSSKKKRKRVRNRARKRNVGPDNSQT